MSEIVKIILETDNTVFLYFFGLISKIAHFLAYLVHLCPKYVLLNIKIFVYTDHKGPENCLAIQSKLQQLCKKTKFAIFLEFKKWPLFDERVHKSDWANFFHIGRFKGDAKKLCGDFWNLDFSRIFRGSKSKILSKPSSTNLKNEKF